MSNLTNVHAVIFDWSGVISDDRKAVHHADGIVLKKYGIENLSFDEWLRDTKASAPEYFAHRGLLGNPASLAKEYEEALAEAKDNGIHPTLYPDAIETIKELKNAQKKLSVVSKHPQNHITHEAQEYGIDNHFFEILGDVKDKYIAIKRVMSDFGIPQKSIIYIGDMIYDIRSAKKAGVISVGVSTGYQSKEVLAAEKPDFLIESLSDLLKI